jgi:signal transduction histidine kinase
MIDLLPFVLGLWGLSGLLLLNHRYPHRLAHSLTQLSLGALTALSIWGPPILQGPTFVLSPVILAADLTVAPRVLAPVVLLVIMVSLLVDRRQVTTSLLLAVTVSLVGVGIALPLLIALSGAVRAALGFSQTLLVSEAGVRFQVAEAASWVAGVYGSIVIYSLLVSKLGGRRRRLAAAGSLLVGGWIQGGLAATGQHWGTALWPTATLAELSGWSLSVVLMLPLGWLAVRAVNNEGLPFPEEGRRSPRWLLRDILDLRQALQESESRVAALHDRLGLLTAIRRQIVRADDSIDLLARVCQQLTATGPLEACWVGLLSENGLESVARSGQPARGAPSYNPLSTIGEAAQQLEAASFESGLRGLRRLVEVHPLHHTIRQVVVGDWQSFPLRSAERAIGMLVVYSDRTEMPPGDVALLEGVAEDLGYGLIRLELQEQRSRRVSELEAVREAMSELLSEHSLADLLDRVSLRAVQLLAAECAEIYLVNEGALTAFPAGRAGRDLESTEFERVQALTHQIVRTGLTDRLAAGGPGSGERGQAGLVGVPLKWKSRVIGVLLAIRPPSKPFESGSVELMQVFADQVSLALENARLIETERQRSAQLEMLRQASLSLTSSLELENVLEAILEQALKVVDAFDAHIFLYDGERLHFGAALWASGAQRAPFSAPRPDGLTATVAQRGERVVVADARDHPIFASADWTWDGAIVGLPLKVGGEVLGVMNLAFDVPHEFSQDELHFLELLADQAAVVLENARLFDRMAAERRRLRLLYDVSRELTASLDPEALLQRAIELTTTYLGGMMGGAIEVDEPSGTMTLVGLAGLPLERLRQIDEATAMRIGKGFVGWIAEQKEAAFSASVNDDPRWLAVSGVDDDVRSAMAAPVFVGGDLRVVMAIFHREPAVFDEEHLELLVAICRQIGVALSNAERYRQVERRLAERTALQQVAQVIGSRLEMDSLLEAIVDQVSKVLGYPVVDITLVEDDELVMRAREGPGEVGRIRMALNEGVIGRVVRTGKPDFVPDVSVDPDYVGFEPQASTEIAVPLHKGGVVIGVLNVEAFEPGGLGEEDLRLLMLVADQISIAIENAALYDRLRQHSAELEAMVDARTAELRKALNQAREADRLKTDFVTDVSHELRTPLSNIQLYIDLLAQTEPERYPEYLETLRREADRLAALIEDLLSVSRLDAGSVELQFRELDLNTLSQALVRDRERLFSERGLDLVWQPSADGVRVRADEQLLSQVIANLMTNAMNYTPRGGRVLVRAENGEPGWATLAVEDSGLGIPDNEMGLLFARFFRGSASRKMGNPGTGLGLAICHEIVERHGGRIAVETKPGKGSCFTIWLPAVGPDQPAG